MNETFKIAAVVVTYNRLELLKQCIDSLRNQTHKLDEIIVVNNSSNDGSLEWLNNQNDLTIITQENSGSAGGQYTGIKTAYEKGYDWIWCSDDDVQPCFSALEIMLELISTKSYEKVASVQLLKRIKPTDTKYTEGADFLEIKKFREKKIANIALAQGYVFTNLFTFEGVLLNSSVVEKVGLPQKDFFCFYDDKEYSLRITRLLPQMKIILIGQVLLNNIKYKSTASQKTFDERVNIQITNFYLYIRNMILTYRLHFPELVTFSNLLLISYNYKRWITKIILLSLLSKNRFQLFKTMYHEIYKKGLEAPIKKYNEYLFLHK